MKLQTFIIIFLLSMTVHAAVSKEVYERAEKFLPRNADKLVFKLDVVPNWMGEHGRFWYVNKLENGKKEFLMFDPVKKKKLPAFNHEKLAVSLSKVTGETYSADKLPFDFIKFIKKDNKDKMIQFDIGKVTWECDYVSYECKKIEKKPEPGSEVSPDGNWIVFYKDYNIYLRSVKSGEEFQLTDDGIENNDYAMPLPDPKLMIEQGTMKITQTPDIMWSPDSKRFVTYRIDQRKAGKMHLIQSVPPTFGRPRLFSYAYPLPGEIDLPKASLYVFDVQTRSKILIDSPQLPLMYYGNPVWYYRFLNADVFYYAEYTRGFQTVRLKMVDTRTGKAQTFIEETSDTYIDSNIWEAYIFEDGSEILWSSERDGWNHIYRYDGKTGKLKNRVTSGPWVMRGIVKVDEKSKVIYFNASGKEKDRNLYFKHLYRVNIDGNDLKLLTPENADNMSNISPNFKYFVNNYSRVDQEPITVLRSTKDGRVVMLLEKADIHLLKNAGWKYPEPFCTKARDGKTDIYGVLYRPTNFDPSKKYPVIDKIYTGPHSFFAPKSFWAYRSEAQSFAELGFIVIEIDGMGTGKRSREFHLVSYKNLGDGGIDDHIAGFKQLAEKYPYMDLERVGIYGGSAGGYDTVRAMLTHPQFYKAGISSSGNQDHRMDKTWWNELWMGFPVKEHYIQQSNITNAHLLQGKLMLAHGDLDENVNPSCTIQLVDALIKANKDFELLIFPNRGHGLSGEPYYLRKRWDFFVKNLLGEEPPKEYRISL